MYLTPTKNHWIIDIETDGLRDQATQIFVVCVENAITDEKHTFTDMEELLRWMPRGAIFVGHNIIGFDCPVLNKLAGTRIGISVLVDTLVLSMLYSPNLAGGHSLEAWGQRLKCPKIHHKDFSAFTEEMLVYCQQDVFLTKRLFNRLAERMRQIGFTEKGAEIEHKAWHIIQNKQKRHGFPFDIKRAHLLYTEIRQREEELKNEIYKLWPPRLVPTGQYKRAYKANGEYSANYLRHSQQYTRVELLDDGEYRVYDYVEFNLGSPKQRIEKLLEIGWEPVKFTKKGNPQVDEESLLKFSESSGNKEAAALAKWIVTNSRGNTINNWMEAYNEDTGAIHGDLWLAGTLRYRHSNPNSANIPSVRLNKKDEILYGEAGSWTYEARDLWTCGDPDDYVLVGMDAKGIQLRVLGHYLDDAAFTEAILSEDPHSANQKAMELPTRALTKTITYATLMGAGDPRIANEAGVSLKEAKAAKAKFFDKVPGLPKLIARLKNELRRKGRITLCDGTPVLVSSEHMVIPYLLQGDESRLMKQAFIFVDEIIRRDKYDAIKVGDIHDEWQIVVRRSQADSFIAAALPCFNRAGEVFGYNVPIDGDAKKGKTWAETH